MRSKLRLFGGLCAIVALLSLGVTSHAFNPSFPDWASQFQLGPQSQTGAAPCNVSQIVHCDDTDSQTIPDWSDLFDSGSADCLAGDHYGDPVPTIFATLMANGYKPITAAFMDDFIKTDSSSYVMSDKNNQQPQTDWHWDTSQVLAKNDITAAYAYAAKDPITGDELIFCGMERVSNNGDSHVDFEFNQANIAPVGDLPPDDCGRPVCSTNACDFSGFKTVGDILIAVEFVNGGGISELRIYRWNGTEFINISGDIPLGSGLNGFNPAIDFGGIHLDAGVIGAFDNQAPITGGAWEGGASVDSHLFTEIGFDVNKIFGGEVCIKTIQVHTRTSQDINSALKDFAITDFNTCSTLTIVKSAEPQDNTQEFDFTLTKPNATVIPFTLRDPSGGGFSNMSTFSKLSTGTYAAQETLPDQDTPTNWAFDNVTCFGNNFTHTTDVSDPLNPKDYVTFATAGEATCIFRNVQNGEITVRKETDPDGLCSAVGFDFVMTKPDQSTVPFTLCGDNPTDPDLPNTVSFGKLKPGDYCVEETSIPGGWEFEGLDVTPSDLGGTTSEGGKKICFTLAPGASVDLDYTNKQLPGSLTIAKVCNICDGTPPTFDFTLTPEGDTGTVYHIDCGQDSGPVSLPPGNYTVQETIPSGWSLDSIMLDGSPVGDTSTGASGTITIGAGEDKTITYTNSKKAKVIIHKVCDPSDDTTTSFDFTTTGGLPDASFSLKCGEFETYTSVTPGVEYTVSETAKAGWSTDMSFEGSCSTTSSTSSPTATFTPQAGETITITYTNNLLPGSLTIAKVCNICEGTPPTFDFTLTPEGESGTVYHVNCGENTGAISLPPGNYTVQEDIPSGWSLDSIMLDGSPAGNTSTGASGTITIAPDQSRTITYTNTKKAKVIIHKVCDPDTDTETSFDFTTTGGLPDASFSLKCGEFETYTSVTPGVAYTVSETAKAGWSTDMSFNGSCSTTSSTSSPTATFIPQAGETITITYTNTLLPGSLKIAKVCNICTGTPPTFDFTLTPEGESGTVYHVNCGEDTGDISLPPGNYTVQETIPSGWSLDSIMLDGSPAGNTSTGASGTITIGPDEHRTITYTNTKMATVIINKICDLINNTTASFEFTTTGGLPEALFTMACGDSKTYSGNVVPGNEYTVTETMLPGWTADFVLSGTCGTTSSTGTPTATFTPQAGETIIITFTNIDPPVTSEGCSPGFWKTHPTVWPSPYSPNDMFSSVFGIPPCFGDHTDITLIDALNLKGGGMIALTRQAVAAVLNSVALDIDYPLSSQCVIDTYNDLCTNNGITNDPCVTGFAPADLSSVVGTLDTYNTIFCPLDGKAVAAQAKKAAAAAKRAAKAALKLQNMLLNATGK